ncbi:MAG: hypothetical protein CMH54_10455 [Myxococcales bacterium]|nr:hypothetical protein [Myxococcales bacterium]
MAQIRQWLLIFGICTITTLSLYTHDANATVIPNFTLPQLIDRADIIAVGTVTKLTATRSGPHQFIYTDYTLQTNDVWLARGTARQLKVGAPIELRQIGGVLGDVEQSVVGTADLRVGDTIIIVARFVEGRAYLVGMGQGARYLSNSSVLTSRPSKALANRKVPGEPLQHFKQRVRNLLDEVGQ